ncbi:hypothetical protein N1851_003714 [Merluccius polli]|uniref:Uncharacterized protein n=1 Tax=Merluccius polli TaxID=89951 RepID=A0AA47N9X1_MERPO|nr:hypothetical protein N1851_003714 [Merluccius polli]
MAPLVELGPGAGTRYAAWTHRDKKALEEDLPPLDEGTGKWIRTFEKKTAGEALCMGDVRSILTSVSTWEVLKDVEKKAGTDRLPDNQEFDPVRNDFWIQLRTEVKPPSKPHESTSEYLTRCTNQWTDHTGEPYTANTVAQAMFRMALIGGLPKEVQMALENVVGLANKPQREWEDHIRHFTEKYNSRLRSKDEETEELKERLLKLEGDGRAWIQAFEKATVEDSLCLGTVRAIITRATSASTTRTLCTRLIETTLRKEQFSERVAQMALLQYEGGDNKSDDEDCAVFKDSGLV